MADYFFVFFRPGTCDLERAIESLKCQGLTVTRDGEEVIATKPRKPQFRICLADGPHVAAEAVEIGEGTPHEVAMRECSVRFEVVVRDLDAALDEYGTLFDVEVGLQEASRGYLFLGWNGNLMGPDAS